MQQFRSAGTHQLDLGMEVVPPARERGQAADSQASSFSGDQRHGGGSSRPQQQVPQQQQQQQQQPQQRRVSFLERHQREQAGLHAAGAQAHQWPQPKIPADNVGFALLRKAGWQEGAGLGAQEQGRVAPVVPSLQKGNRGIGFDGRAAQEHAAKPSSKAEEAAAVKRARLQMQQEVGAKRGAKVDKIVADELAAESTEAKVKRYSAVIHQEGEDAKRRAISRILSAGLNDPFDQPFSSGDSNPLGRKHRLTALNPLLDSDDD